MFIAPRRIRARADDLTHPPIDRTTAEQDRHDRILAIGQALLAEFGRVNIGFTTLAMALRIAPATLRRHFCDIDSLLADILQRHVRSLMNVIGSISRDHPGYAAQRRSAYLDATRTPMGGLTEIHLLLVRDRHSLPDDLLATVEQLRDLLGQSLCQENPAAALSLLDNPCIGHGHIEAMLRAFAAAQENPEPAPKPPREDPARQIVPPPQPAPANHYVTADEVAAWLGNDARLLPRGRGPPKH